MITIIDYGSGNLKSIRNGFQHIGVEAKISRDPNEIKEAEALILPGVGAFGKAMENLSGFKGAIYNHIDDGKPFLGVCLGLQILFSQSQESPGIKGLDIFKGNVTRFPESLKEEGKKIPHMGWNNLQIHQKCPVLNGVKNDYMYFVHSYYVQPVKEDIIIATVDYGVKVPAVVSKDNVIATQFHPEKSGEIGLKMLQNFVKMVF